MRSAAAHSFGPSSSTSARSEIRAPSVSSAIDWNPAIRRRRERSSVAR